jgi:hypothetical protein
VEHGVAKNKIIAELTRSSHGKLDEYLEIGRAAVRNDGEFYAHLVAWNAENGQIRDSKVALPVIGLIAHAHPEFIQNALAHMALLDPLLFTKAIRFGWKPSAAVNRRHEIRRLVPQYLRAREAHWKWWEGAALQHRASMKDLYSLFHVKPNAMADLILYKDKPPKGTVFALLKELKHMSAQEAAGTIITKEIPFLVARAALGAKAKEPDLLLALITQMSPTEVVHNTKHLEALGIKNNPALRAAFDQALVRASTSKKATFKTSRAVEAVRDESTKEKLREVQEKQIAARGGVEGNWLIIGDKSASMQLSIELSRQAAATLAKSVKGKVHLIFADTSPRYIDATGKTYDQLLAETRRIEAGGDTSLGCALLYAMERNLEIDGIAIVSDGAENTPPIFAFEYQKLCAKIGKEVPVYLYWTHGQDTRTLQGSMLAGRFDLQVFDVRRTMVDYYSLPNLIETMRANRYSLVDEIMATKLLTVEEALKGGRRAGEAA